MVPMLIAREPFGEEKNEAPPKRLVNRQASGILPWHDWSQLDALIRKNICVFEQKGAKD